MYADYGVVHEGYICIAIGEVVFDVVRGRQGLVVAGNPCNGPGSKLLPERVAHALLPIPIVVLNDFPNEGKV